MKKILFAMCFALFAMVGFAAQDGESKEAKLANCSLEGKVTCENDGEPIIGASVMLSLDGSNVVYGTQTDGNGRYYISGIVARPDYILTFSMIGYQPVTVENFSIVKPKTVKNQVLRDYAPYKLSDKPTNEEKSK